MQADGTAAGYACLPCRLVSCFARTAGEVLPDSFVAGENCVLGERIIGRSVSRSGDNSLKVVLYRWGL